MKTTEFIVMTAKAQMPASCQGRYGKVAVCEVMVGVRPKMISERWPRAWSASSRCATSSTPARAAPGQLMRLPKRMLRGYVRDSIWKPP